MQIKGDIVAGAVARSRFGHRRTSGPGVLAALIGLAGCGSKPASTTTSPANKTETTAASANAAQCNELFDHLLHLQTQKEVAYTFGADPNEPDPADAEREVVRKRVESKRPGFVNACGAMSAATIQCGMDAVGTSLAIECDARFDFSK
jgi:hypothetical protein